MATADRLIEVFNEAKAVPVGADRDVFLADTCGDDAELKEQVLSLLRASEGAGDFLKNAPVLSPEIEAELARLKPEEDGERIGNYKLLEKIGEGGFGTVWVADQERPVRRRVALKIIKLGMDTRDVIARFEQERQAIAMMDHPHIAKIFDAGATQYGRPFFVMELVRGIKITDYCDQAKLSTGDRLGLFIAVCEAVQHAHQKGIIHRDIKPSNILVTLHDGVPVPKVIDFGVAKATQQQRLTDLTVYTQFEQMIGTPLYMSPEQAEMSGLDVDTRSDIYSLGVLLYELLTGRTPFDPEELMRQGLDEIRRSIREQEPKKPSIFVNTMEGGLGASVAQHRQTDSSQLTSQLRGDLDWIVMKALEKDRTRRYETANGLALDVQRHLANEPVLARPASQLYRFRRFVTRNRLAFAAASAVAVALLAALVVLAVSARRITRERDEKDHALAQAKERLFDALLQRARAGRFSRQMGQRLDSLDALAEAARIRLDERLRDEAIAAMALPDLRLGPKWTLDNANTADADYRLSAAWDEQGVITVRSIPDRREVQRIDPGGKTAYVALSGDGRFIAGLDERHTLRVWRVADGQSVLDDPMESCAGLAFSKNSAELAAGQGNSIVRLDMATGREIHRWQAGAPVHSLAFSPDDRQLAVGYVNAAVASVYDIAKGTLVTVLPVGSIAGQVVAWHPDGIRLAVSGSNPRIQIWDVPAKRKLASLEGHVQQVGTLSFHPDGELLASNGWESICRLWHPASGRQLMQWPCQTAHVAFSPDGRSLGVVTGPDDQRLVEVAPCPEYRTLVSSLGAGQGEHFEGDVSPDGRLLAVGMSDGVRVWALASGREVAFMELDRVQSAIFTPNSNELITCGDAGLLRWSMPDRADVSEPLHLGSAQKIALPFTPTRASISGDGHALAVVSESAGGALIVDLASGGVQGSVLPHPGAGYVALSPDGAWVATAGWHSDALRLWNVQTGKMIEEWKEDGLVSMSIAPDSRTLVVARAREFSFWDVQTLQLIRRVPRGRALYASRVAFSPDGKLIAMEVTPGVIHLAEAATGRTVARFTDPNGDRSTWMSFTPDGTQLASSSFEAKAIHLWDLRRIRTRLKAMGLDWEWPEFPAAN